MITMNTDIVDTINNIKKDIDQLNSDAIRFNKYKLDNFVKSAHIDEILMNASPENLLNTTDNILELHTTITSREQKIRDILRYHMSNGNVVHTTDNLNDATKLIKTILDTYHYRAGGYNFEDCVWNMHDQSSKLFSVDDGSVIFSNSIKHELLHDIESFKFLSDMVKFIRKHLSDDFNIKWKKIHDEHRETWWVLIKVIHTKFEHDKSDEFE